MAQRLELQLRVPEKLQLYRAAQQNEGAGDAGLQLEPQEEWTCAICLVPPAEGVWVGCSTCNNTWVCAPCAGMAGATPEEGSIRRRVGLGRFGQDQPGLGRTNNSSEVRLLRMHVASVLGYLARRCDRLPLRCRGHRRAEQAQPHPERLRHAPQAPQGLWDDASELFHAPRAV